MTISSSPERGTFQSKSAIERMKKGNDADAQLLVEMYAGMKNQQIELEATEAWKKDNLEYDLRSTDWILEKVRASDDYAQNLYAALCNNDFTKNDVWPVLLGKRWSCSWRHAGGIIADMQQKGDYIDWYCSGIRQSNDYTANPDKVIDTWVTESIVTDEISADLLKLGWVVNTEDENE